MAIASVLAHLSVHTSRSCTAPSLSHSPSVSSSPFERCRYSHTPVTAGSAQLGIEIPSSMWCRHRGVCLQRTRDRRRASTRAGVGSHTTSDAWSPQSGLIFCISATGSGAHGWRRTVRGREQRRTYNTAHTDTRSRCRTIHASVHTALQLHIHTHTCVRLRMRTRSPPFLISLIPLVSLYRHGSRQTAPSDMAKRASQWGARRCVHARSRAASAMQICRIARTHRHTHMQQHDSSIDW